MSVSLGPKLQKLINANIGDAYPDQFRAFLRAMDTLIQPSAIATAQLNPPLSPSNGDTYILLASSTPSGAWAGQSGNVAVYSTQIMQSGTNIAAPGWEFYSPNPGWSFFVNSTSSVWVYNGSEWVDSATGSSQSLIYNVPSSATPVMDASRGVTQRIILSVAVTSSSLLNPSDQEGITVVIVQPSSGGLPFIWPTNFKGAVDLSSTDQLGTSASDTVVQKFVWDGSNMLATAGAMIL